MELYTEKSKLWYFPPESSKDIPRYAISCNISKLSTDSNKNDDHKKEDVKPENDRSTKSLGKFELYEEILPLKISDNLQVIKNDDGEDLIFNNRNLGVIISEYTNFINCWNDGIELLKRNPDVIEKIDNSKNSSPVNKKLQLSKYLYNNLNSYLIEKQLSVKIITWNISGLSSIYKSEDISELFKEEKDIYVLNLQETIPLTLNTFYSSPLIVQEWISYILETLSKLHSLDYEYLSDNRLLGLTTIIIVRKCLKPQISNVELSTTGTGILNVFGNKGAILISFNLSFDKDILAHIEELKEMEKQKLSSKIPVDNNQTENVRSEIDSVKENVTTEDSAAEEINQHGYKVVIVNCHLSAGDQNLNKRKKQLQSIENNLNLKKYYKGTEFSIFSQRVSSSSVSRNPGVLRRDEDDTNSDTQDTTPATPATVEIMTNIKSDTDFKNSKSNANSELENGKSESFTDIDEIEISEIPSSKLSTSSIGSTSSVDLSNNELPESNKDNSLPSKLGTIPKINTSVSLPYAANNQKSLASPTESIETKKSNENQSIASKLASPILSKFYNNASSSLLSVTNSNSNSGSAFQREGIASRLASPIFSKFYNYSPTNASPFVNGNDSGLNRDNVGSATDNFDDCFVFIGGDLNFRLSNSVTREFIDKPIKKMASKSDDTDLSDIASTTTEVLGKDSSLLSSLPMDNSFDDSGFLDSENVEDDFKQELKALINAGKYNSLMKFDTLNSEIQRINLFNGFIEPEINFLPTYKLLISEKIVSNSNVQSSIKNDDIEFTLEDDSTIDVKGPIKNKSSESIARQKELEKKDSNNKSEEEPKETILPKEPKESKETKESNDSNDLNDLNKPDELKEQTDSSEINEIDKTKMGGKEFDIRAENLMDNTEAESNELANLQKKSEKMETNAEELDESSAQETKAADIDVDKLAEEKSEKGDVKSEKSENNSNENPNEVEKGSKGQGIDSSNSPEDIEENKGSNEQFIAQPSTLIEGDEISTIKNLNGSIAEDNANKPLPNASNGDVLKSHEIVLNALTENENIKVLDNSSLVNALPSSKYNFDRIPSYCDRIFYNEKNIFGDSEKTHVHVDSYGSPDICSLTDHKPVFMDLNLKDIKLIDFEKRYQLMKLFLKKLDSEENSQKSSAHVIPTEFSKQGLELLSKEKIYEFQIFNDGARALRWEIVNYDTKATNYYKSYNAENIEVKFNYFNDPLIQISPCKGMIPAKGVQRVKIKLNSIDFGITRVVASLILRIIGSNDFFLTYDFNFKESSVFGQSLDLLNKVEEFGSSSGIPPSIYELVNFLSNNLRHDMFDFVYDESKPDILKEKILSPLDSVLRSRLEHRLPLDKEFIRNHIDPDGDNEVLVSVVARTLIFLLNSIYGGIIPKEFSTFILSQEEEKPAKKKGFFNSLMKQKTDKSRSTDIVTKILEFLPGLRANVFMYIISFLSLYVNQYGNKQIDSLVGLFEEALFRLPADASKSLKGKRREVLKILI